MKIDEISEIIAKELNIHPIIVKEINRIQWKFLHKEMQSGDFNPVNIFYIGKFTAKKNNNKYGYPELPEFLKQQYRDGTRKRNI